MQLVITRDTDDGVCTLGRLYFAGVTLFTIERPWFNNTPGRSCIPLGTYSLVLHDSELHPKTFALENAVLGVTHWGPSLRTAVLIHPANVAQELRGCIAPGRSVGIQRVNESRLAFADLMAQVPWVDGHTIEIREGV